jgi:hypothetical protein
LISGVNFENAVFLERERVHRLQREMHDGARGVGSFNLLLRRSQRSIDARVVDQQRTSLRIRDQLGRALLDIGLGYGGCLPRTPLHVHQIGRLVCRYEGLRVYHHPARYRSRRVVQREALQVSGHALRRRIVNRDHLGVVARRRNFRTRVHHPLHHGVQAIAAFAIDLRRNIFRYYIPPDQTALVRRFDGHVFELLGREGSSQIAVCHNIAVRDRSSSGVHRVVTCRATLLRNAKQLRTFFDQSNAAGRARG